MKDAVFLGDTLRVVREFPEKARRMAGRQIRRVQQGDEPIDWKPFSSIGPNVREIRIRESGGAFRVIYQATLADVVLVISAFEKKTQRTSRHEIEKARTRLRAYMQREARK
jgi:phage-related protein